MAALFYKDIITKCDVINKETSIPKVYLMMK